MIIIIVVINLQIWVQTKYARTPRKRMNWNNVECKESTTNARVSACRQSGAPRRHVTRMMPIGVPKVPFRTPREGGWQWVDLWNCLVKPFSSQMIKWNKKLLGEWGPWCHVFRQGLFVIIIITGQGHEGRQQKLRNSSSYGLWAPWTLKMYVWMCHQLHGVLAIANRLTQSWCIL